MKSTDIKSNGELNFTFEGDYEVNALAVAKAIEGLVELSTVTASHNYPESEVRLSVRAVKPGSLAIAFMIATTAIQTLLSPDGVEYANNLASTIVAFFGIKRFLKDRSPKAVSYDGDNIVIERPDGTKITAPKEAGVYFIDQSVDKSITNIIESASISPGVSGIRVCGGNSEAAIKREDFEECSAIMQFDPCSKKQITYTRRDVLFIRKPDLIGDSQWGFRTDKNIMADMDDKDFMDKIHSRQVVVFSGMHLIADLEINVDIDDNNLPDASSCRYSVKHVDSWGTPEDLQSNMWQ